MIFKRRTEKTARNRARRVTLFENLEVRWLFANNPSVATVTPAAMATGVALNMPITCTLTLPNGGIYPNSINGSDVNLFPTGKTGNSNQVVAVVNTTGGGDAIILTPSVNLQPNTSYTFTITAAVTDVHGDTFTPFTSTFTTGNTAPPVNQNIAFSKVALPTTAGGPFTCMKIGPDGLLYASTEDGRIFRYVMNPDGTLGTAQIITSLQTAYGTNRLISGFAFDPQSTAANPIIWVSNTFYALSGATNGPNFTGSLTVMSGPNLENVTDAIIHLPRSVADHVNDQPVFQPGTRNLYFCMAGNNAYGAPDTTWGNRSETMLSAAILKVNTAALNLSGPALDSLTPDAGGTYNPSAAGAPLTIFATGIRNAFTLYFDSTGALWGPANGSSAGGNTPAGNGVPALTGVQQTEDDVLDKFVAGGYYGHPNPVRGQYVLDEGNPSTGGVPGLVFTAYPSGTNPDPKYKLPNYIFGFHNSPDGFIQYTGNAFGGALNGKFLVTEYSAGDDIVVLTPDSNDNIIGGLASSVKSPGPDRTVSGFSGFTNPVTLLENPTTGNIYVSELGGSKLTLLRPQTLTGTISANASVLPFVSIATGNTGAGASRAVSVTITNTGLNALTFKSGAFSVVDDPNAASAKSNFTITNSGSLPTTLASGASFKITLTYSATAVGLQQALLQINSSDPVTPTLDISLNGIGTAGLSGVNEPSLAQVLRANNIPTIVGAGPNDSAINTVNYPQSPDSSSQEVPMQRLVKAGAAPVTITPIASFSSASQPVSKIGYYTSGDPNDTTELFYINQTDAQTTNPTAQGVTTFDPGSGVFSLYGTFPGTATPSGALDTQYSEDALNTQDLAHPRKFRFFPYETASGTIVPNTFVVAVEDSDDPTFNTFANFVGIISNVQAAPDVVNAPVAGLTNPQGVTSSTNYVFNRIQVPNPTTPDVVHDTNQIQINNSGDQPLVINSLTLSDTTNWTLVNPPAAGTSIAPGGTLTLTVRFIATSAPPGQTINETNNSMTTNGVATTSAGGVWNGTLAIGTNDPVTPVRTAYLAGYWQDQSESNNAPGLQTIVNLMFNFGTTITAPLTSTSVQQYPNVNSKATAYGEEVLSGLWNVADGSLPVSVEQIAAFHSQSIASTLGWYSSGSTTTHNLATATDGASEGQSILPTQSGSTALAAATFIPGGTFGWNINGEKSQDNLNTVDIGFGRSGHAVRFWPARTAAGEVIPNEWIMSMSYQNQSTNNNDFQNNVYLVSNMTPSTRPPTPNDLSASVGATGVNVQWSAVPGATGYNVYRMIGFGTLTKLTSKPITSTTFIDTTATVGNVIGYHVTAVNSSSVESVAADTTLNLGSVSNAGPTTAPMAPVITTTDGSSGNQVVINFTPSPTATSYIVDREGPGQTSYTQITSPGITTTPYTDTNVTPGATYSYEIEAINSVGASAFSTPVTVTVAAAPAAPMITLADGSSATQVVVSWTAPANATSYVLQREGAGETTFTTITTPPFAATTFTDTNVTPGATYQYQVQAVGSVGPSPFSAIVSATVATSASAPPAPTIQTVDGSASTQVLINWTTSAGATGYILQREGPGETTYTTITTPAVTTTSYIDTNVTPGATYSYQVQAMNGGGSSAFSAPVAVTVATTPTAPPAPMIVSADGSSGTQIVITWTASAGATSYVLQREGPGETTFTSLTSPPYSQTSYTDTAVTLGGTYMYQVQAVNSAGPSAFSAVTSATVQVPTGIPSAPTNLQTTVSSNNQVVLTWTAGIGAASYIVERATPGTNMFSVIAPTVVGTTFTDTNVVAGATYQYEVLSQNSSGTSATAATATAVVPAAPDTLDVMVGKGGFKSVSFVDANNTTVTIRLIGPGLATVHFTADTTITPTKTFAGEIVQAMNVAIGNISTTGTTRASTLSVTTKGGARTINIGGISVDASLNSITAPTAALTGDLSIAGSAGSIALGSATAATLNVGGPLRSLKIASVSGATVTAGGAITSITANTWMSNHAITAPSIGTIAIAGDGQFDIQAAAVRSVRVRGNLHDSTFTLTGGGMNLPSLTAGAINAIDINAAGNIGSIIAGTMTGSRIFAGVATLATGQTLPSQPSDFSADAFIGNIILKPRKGISSFFSSNVAASVIKHVSLGQIQLSNSNTTFGLAATKVTAFTAINPSNSKTFTLSRLTSESQVMADFAMKGINPLEFVIQIV